MTEMSEGRADDFDRRMWCDVHAGCDHTDWWSGIFHGRSVTRSVALVADVWCWHLTLLTGISTDFAVCTQRYVYRMTYCIDLRRTTAPSFLLSPCACLRPLEFYENFWTDFHERREQDTNKSNPNPNPNSFSGWSFQRSKRFWIRNKTFPVMIDQKYDKMSTFTDFFSLPRSNGTSAIPTKSRFS